MTVPTSNRFDSVSSAGGSSGLAGLVPFITNRAPTAQDIKGPFGPFRISQTWVDSVDNLAYILTSYAPLNGQMLAVWTLSSASSTLGTLTGSTGTAVPSAGNIQIAGTADQITTVGSGSTITLSIPSGFIAPGFIESTAGNFIADNGSLLLQTAGNKINIAIGANASVGKSSAMTAGSITISTTAVTTSSLIFLTNAGPAGSVGTLSVGTIVAGTSFVINSSDGADTSVVNWWVIN